MIVVGGWDDALASEVVPALRELAPTPDLPGARVGMGASLGALAAFHAHRVHRHAFGHRQPGLGAEQQLA